MNRITPPQSFEQQIATLATTHADLIGAAALVVAFVWILRRVIAA